jgi:nucleotide-binding universal stress UspA family protein
MRAELLERAAAGVDDPEWPRRAMTERILVAVDASDASISALKAARSLAEARPATLAIVHVPLTFSDPEPLIPRSHGINQARLLELERIAREALENRISEVEGFAVVDRFFELGSPAEAIVRRAAAWNADLIVVGSHGRRGILRALLGSVAEKVVRLAQCAVLVSRPSGGSGVVVAATDLSDPLLPIALRAAEEARLRGATLVVVHATSPQAQAAAPVTPLPSDLGAAADSLEDMPDLLASRLSDAMRRGGVFGEPLVVAGDVVDSVTRIVDERDAELLVVGAHTGTGGAAGSLGRTAEKLARLATCSVLIVRDVA